MADLSQFSDEQLMALYQGDAQTQPEQNDMSSYSDAELMAMYQQEQPKQDISLGQRAGNLWEGIKRGATFGFGDEAQAGIAALYAGLASPDLTVRDAYGQALEELRAEYDLAREQTPWTTGIGEFGGALTTGIAATPRAVTGALSNAATKGFLPRAGTTSAIGAASGGLYGYGTGQGSAEERASNAAFMGALGAGGGFVGSGVGSGVEALARTPLAQKMADVIARRAKPKNQLVAKTAQEIAEAQDDIAPIVGGQSAYGKIGKQLKKDFGSDYESAMKAYKEGDISLADLYGSRTRTLAQGAAQYPSGKAAAQKYFDEKIGGSYDRILSTVNKNIADIDNYLTTVDDIVFAGQTKARPLYEKAYQGQVDIKGTLPQEVTSAIAAARRQYPSELQGLPDNSVKVLDYAKRALDDQINTAQRAGKNNFARSRTVVKNDLLDLIDNQVPDYKEARRVSGDYLTITGAMDSGRKALKTDAELLKKQMEGLNDVEKSAFLTGVSKAVRDEVSKIGDNANPYKRIMGSPEKRKKLQAVLSPSQYKNLETSLKAEDRLFKMRNEVLGGSPTAGKLEAKNMISSGVNAVDDIAQVPRKTMIAGLKMAFDGLDDKTAGKVSEILYETDPVKKLQIIDKIKGAKDFTPQEKALVQKAYFESADKFDILKTTSIEAGGIAPAIVEGQQ